MGWKGKLLFFFKLAAKSVIKGGKCGGAGRWHGLQPASHVGRMGTACIGWFFLLHRDENIVPPRAGSRFVMGWTVSVEGMGNDFSVPEKHAPQGQAGKS